jgi:hypothetical protein
MSPFMSPFPPFLPFNGISPTNDIVDRIFLVSSRVSHDCGINTDYLAKKTAQTRLLGKANPYPYQKKPDYLPKKEVFKPVPLPKETRLLGKDICAYRVVLQRFFGFGGPSNKYLTLLFF